MLTSSLLRVVLLSLLGGCMVLQVLATTCYHLDGTNAGPQVGACNSNATGTDNSHSACCNIENADACLSTGLCLNSLSRQSNHLLWATGCTDPTFQDPSCPQYCRGLKIDNAHLKPCNDSGFWCCESDANILTTEKCCKQSFELTQPIGTVIAQMASGAGALPIATGASSPTPSTSTSSSPDADSSSDIPDASSEIPSGAVAGLAVEAVLLAATLAGLAFVLWRNRILNRRAKEAEAAAVVARSAHAQAHQQMNQQQYHWQPPPSSHGTISHAAPYGFGSPVEADPVKRSELHSPAPTYPELPAEPMHNELASDPRTPASIYKPNGPFNP
ncbi:hypothetical protein GGR52DRAFT_276457 [Hypoxylon sp. FL1284]|nr:hypothetical protein GGR52DRAFT_276457 [Hypoxylon sp. FL1284]